MVMGGCGQEDQPLLRYGAGRSCAAQVPAPMPAPMPAPAFEPQPIKPRMPDQTARLARLRETPAVTQDKATSNTAAAVQPPAKRRWGDSEGEDQSLQNYVSEEPASETPARQVPARNLQRVAPEYYQRLSHLPPPPQSEVPHMPPVGTTEWQTPRHVQTMSSEHMPLDNFARRLPGHGSPMPPGSPKLLDSPENLPMRQSQAGAPSEAQVRSYAPPRYGQAGDGPGFQPYRRRDHDAAGGLGGDTFETSSLREHATSDRQCHGMGMPRGVARVNGSMHDGGDSDYIYGFEPYSRRDDGGVDHCAHDRNDSMDAGRTFGDACDGGDDGRGAEFQTYWHHELQSGDGCTGERGNAQYPPRAGGYFRGDESGASGGLESSSHQEHRQRDPSRPGDRPRKYARAQPGSADASPHFWDWPSAGRYDLDGSGEYREEFQPPRWDRDCDRTWESLSGEGEEADTDEQVAHRDVQTQFNDGPRRRQDKRLGHRGSGVNDRSRPERWDERPKEVDAPRWSKNKQDDRRPFGEFYESHGQRESHHRNAKVGADFNAPRRRQDREYDRSSDRDRTHIGRVSRSRSHRCRAQRARLHSRVQVAEGSYRGHSSESRQHRGNRKRDRTGWSPEGPGQESGHEQPVMHADWQSQSDRNVKFRQNRRPGHPAGGYHERLRPERWEEHVQTRDDPRWNPNEQSRGRAGYGAGSDGELLTPQMGLEAHEENAVCDRRGAQAGDAQEAALDNGYVRKRDSWRDSSEPIRERPPLKLEERVQDAPGQMVDGAGHATDWRPLAAADTTQVQRVYSDVRCELPSCSPPGSAISGPSNAHVTPSPPSPRAYGYWPRPQGFPAHLPWPPPPLPPLSGSGISWPINAALCPSALPPWSDGSAPRPQGFPAHLPWPPPPVPPLPGGATSWPINAAFCPSAPPPWFDGFAPRPQGLPAHLPWPPPPVPPLSGGATSWPINAAPSMSAPSPWSDDGGRPGPRPLGPPVRELRPPPPPPSPVQGHGQSGRLGSRPKRAVIEPDSRAFDIEVRRLETSLRAARERGLDEHFI